MIPLSLLWDTRTKSVYLKWDGLFSLGVNEGKIVGRVFGLSIPLPLRRSEKRKRFRVSLRWADLKEGLFFLRKWKLKRAEGTVSFPNPVMNGMLYGWMAAFDSWRGDQRVNFTINFNGENRFSGEAKLSLKALVTELRRWIFPLLWRMGRKMTERR